MKSYLDFHIIDVVRFRLGEW